MAIISKKTSVGGGWVKASEIVSGTKAKLVSEAAYQSGEYGEQLVAKIRFQGQEGEPLNVNLNKTTANGLVDAFGADSQDWIGKVLTAHTEKQTVSGKRVTVMYLIAEGFTLGEDDGGYVTIVPEGEVRGPKKVADADLPF